MKSNKVWELYFFKGILMPKRRIVVVLFSLHISSQLWQPSTRAAERISMAILESLLNA